MFDIERFATDYFVELHYPGEPNVTRGWVNVPCPYCPMGDTSWHFGYNLSSGLCSCWRCNAKGPAEKLVSGVLNISWDAAKKIVQEYQTSRIENKHEIRTVTAVSLPRGTKPGLGEQHVKYLQSRGFDSETLQKNFHLHHTDHLGEPPHAIIIPILYDNEIVNYILRDITGQASVKYKLCASDKAKMQRSELLYNFNPYMKTGIVVEGVTDVWAIGKGAFATFGTKFSTEQLQLIARSKLETVYVVYDGDDAGLVNGTALANQLASIVRNVELILLDKGDPAEQTNETLEELRGLLYD